jgi:hypothetical protein
MLNLNQTVKSHYFIANDIYLFIYLFNTMSQQLTANAPSYAYKYAYDKLKLEFGIKYVGSRSRF